MDPKDRKQSWTIWYVLIAFLAVAVLQQFWTTLAQTEMMPYSQFEQLVSAKQVSDVVISAGYDPGHAQDAACRRQDPVRDGPGRSGDRRQARSRRREGDGRGPQRLSWRDPFLGSAARRLLFPVDLSVPRHGREARARRNDVDRQIARENLCRDRHQGHVQGRGGRRRGQIRVAGDRIVPEGHQVLRPARGAHAQGHSAGRPSGNGKDAAGAGGGGRGRRSLLLDLRLRVRGNVRRRRRRAGARSVRAGAQGGPLHHLHRRTRRARPQPQRRRRHGRLRREGADAQPAARRTRRIRPHQRRRAAGRDQPAGNPRSGPAARRPLRSSGAGRPSRPQGPSGNPESAHPQDRRGPERRPRPDRRA